MKENAAGAAWCWSVGSPEHRDKQESLIPVCCHHMAKSQVESLHVPVQEWSVVQIPSQRYSPDCAEPARLRMCCCPTRSCVTPVSSLQL